MQLNFDVDILVVAPKNDRQYYCQAFIAAERGTDILRTLLPIMLQNKKYLLDIFLFEAWIELDNTTDVSSVINGDKMTCMMLCWGLRGFLLRPFQSNI